MNFRSHAAWQTGFAWGFAAVSAHAAATLTAGGQAPAGQPAPAASAALATKDQKIQQQKDKLAEDPTKVVTQIGASYGGQELRISGSASLGPVNKINASVNTDASEWRLGGSWLFDLAIVNVSAGRKDFDDGSSQTHYSIGTYVPLSHFCIQPWGCQIFGMAGYTYNNGEVDARGLDEDAPTFDPGDPDRPIFVPVTSSSGYVGAFALKPLSEKWRLLSFVIGSLGTNDYSGYAAGIGAGFSITKRQSVSLSLFTQDNSFGSDQMIRLAYRYQFN